MRNNLLDPLTSPAMCPPDKRNSPSLYMHGLNDVRGAVIQLYGCACELGHSKWSHRWRQSAHEVYALYAPTEGHAAANWLSILHGGSKSIAIDNAISHMVWPENENVKLYICVQRARVNPHTRTHVHPRIALFLFLVGQPPSPPPPLPASCRNQNVIQSTPGQSALISHNITCTSSPARTRLRIAFKCRRSSPTSKSSRHFDYPFYRYRRQHVHEAADAVRHFFCVCVCERRCCLYSNRKMRWTHARTHASTQTRTMMMARKYAETIQHTIFVCCVSLPIAICSTRQRTRNIVTHLLGVCSLNVPVKTGGVRRYCCSRTGGPGRRPTFVCCDCDNSQQTYTHASVLNLLNF